MYALSTDSHGPSQDSGSWGVPLCYIQLCALVTSLEPSTVSQGMGR